MALGQRTRTQSASESQSIVGYITSAARADGAPAPHSTRANAPVLHLAAIALDHEVVVQTEDARRLRARRHLDLAEPAR
eukprot:2542015-Pleurochrysis_carterae.AAC.1